MTKEEIKEIIESYTLDEKYKGFFYIEYMDNICSNNWCWLNIFTSPMNGYKYPLYISLITKKETIYEIIENGIKKLLITKISIMKNTRKKLCI